MGSQTAVLKRVQVIRRMHRYDNSVVAAASFKKVVQMLSGLMLFTHPMMRRWGFLLRPILATPAPATQNPFISDVRGW
jgi:hypothetical protein